MALKVIHSLGRQAREQDVVKTQACCLRDGSVFCCSFMIQDGSWAPLLALQPRVLSTALLLVFSSAKLWKELVEAFASGVNLQNPLLSLKKSVHSIVVPPVRPTLWALVARTKEKTFSLLSWRPLRAWDHHRHDILGVNQWLNSEKNISFILCRSPTKRKHCKSFHNSLY